MNECAKYEEWSRGFVSLMQGLTLIYMVSGIWLTYQHNIIATIIFLSLCLLVNVMAIYTYCNHCYYYGKRCYFGIGLVVPYFSKKIEEPPSESKMKLVPIIMLIAFAFPLVSIFSVNSFYLAIGYSVLYLIAPVSVMVLIRKQCSHCKFEGCLSHPDRKTILT